MVYVSGSANKMPADVEAAFVDAVSSGSSMGQPEAARLIKQMQMTGRYHVEAWA